MKTISVNQPINLKVVRFELNFTTQSAPVKETEKRRKIKIPIPNLKKRRSEIPTPPAIKNSQKRGVQELVEELLDEIYADQRDWSSYSHGSISAASVTSSNSHCHDQTDSIELTYLEDLSIEEIQEQICNCETRMQLAGKRLAKYVRVRDRLRRQQKKLCNAFTVLLRHITGEHGARFSVTPTLGGEGSGEGGYAEWLHAMRLVARLPAGVPQHFRRKLWLNLAERHITARGIDWPASERACFRGSALPDDTELGAQILKDLHRTGCSLFCGAEGRENQAMLRRVLLAYARWNKDVGYCQGFNMLAAIILEVMDKSESDSLKVMIYLVEAVLPEGYFADDLRGLSADMAAFRDLLRLRLPRLAKHMDHLQRISDGGGVEPPLPDVFTMQWFLTLYATWLQRDSLLRIWDLVMLDGNEVLLLTALAIWDMLQDRILSARSADEFYSCMGGGAGAVWEAGDALVARVVALGSVPELPRLRDLHRYRVAPPAPPAAPTVQHPPLHTAMQSMTKRGLRLFYSEDEDSSDDGNRMALATVTPTRREERERTGTGDRLSLDIGALKRQYARLRERQRQAHVILAAACARHAAVGVPTSPTSLTVNNLLLGKSALVSSRGRRLGPPPGAVPPSRQMPLASENMESPSTGRSSETISWKEEKSRKTLSRRNSVKWKDVKKEKELEKRKASIDFDETGDGIIVSEREADEMIASLRSRSSSDSSSYSSRSASSSDTSLCDENERGSDSETDLPDDNKNKNSKSVKKSDTHNTKETETLRSPELKKMELSTSPQMESEILTPEKQVRNITEYLDSAAGEPLRTYIDGFEKKQRDSFVTSSEINHFIPINPLPICDTNPLSNISPYNLKQDLEKNDVLLRLNSSRCEDITRNSEIIKPAQFTDLSPVDLSPCNFGITIDSESSYDYQSNFRRSSISRMDISSRPPDIIDSFTMYPNFVPDIDLSDKNVSDYESPPRSPGAESIVVSEDEPPIPLQIDKYFEHSPEFFGARVTDPNNSDIPNRRPPRRQCRIPKKPDSLTLKSSHNDPILKNESERASSLPQTQSFTKNDELTSNTKNGIKLCHLQDNIEKSCENKTISIKMPANDTSLISCKPETAMEVKDSISPKDFMLRSGRKNSERALQIIQENSKILNRILTKQNISGTNKSEDKKNVNNITLRQQNTSKEYTSEKKIDDKLIDSPLLKESTSDSLIGYRKRSVHEGGNDKNDFIRIRPISIDDPFSFEARNPTLKTEEIAIKSSKSPSSDCLGNKTDLYGWENKGFQAKCEYKNVTRPEVYDYRKETDLSGRSELYSNELKIKNSSNWSRRSFSGETKTSVTLPSTEIKDSSTYERRYVTDDYSYPFSSKYNEFLVSNASDVCSKTVDQGPKICDNLSKTDNSQVSDFAHVVTSSISFTYEPSAEDDSPTGAKSNSSDTLCQITSLDQVSTPISPKVFPNRETPTLPKDYAERSDKTKIESDDTCSAITSLIDTDTMSSLSYPRSPSTGSYYPFPTRPVLRVPKELGVKLGMYSKDVVHSPSK